MLQPGLFSAPPARSRLAAGGVIRCPCGPWPTWTAFKAHRDAAACPWNAPEGPRFAFWALHVRKPTPAEIARREAARARLEAVKANPVYQEHARAKREWRKSHA